MKTEALDINEQELNKNKNKNNTCLQRKIKKNVNKCKQISSGKLSRLARMKFDFPM